MSDLRILVDRLTVALFGVSASVGDDFADALERRLEERLGGLRAEPLARSALDRRDLSLGRVDLGGALDAEALAGIVADRLVEVLTVRAGTGSGERRI